MEVVTYIMFAHRLHNVFRLHFKKLYFRSLKIKTLQPYYCSSSSNEPQDAIRKQWKYDVIVSKATNRISWSSSCNNSCSVNNVPVIAAGLLSSHLLINSTATTETVTFFVLFIFYSHQRNCYCHLYLVPNKYGLLSKVYVSVDNRIDYKILTISCLM